MAKREQRNSPGVGGLPDIDQANDHGEFANAIIDTTNIPVIVLDKTLKVKFATKVFHQRFNTTADQISGLNFWEVNECPSSDPELINKLTETIDAKTSLNGYEIKFTFPLSGEFYFRINANTFQQNGKLLLIVAISDITDWCNEKSKLTKCNSSLQDKIDLTTESAEIGTWEMDTETGKFEWDKRTREFFDIPDEIVTYERFLQCVYPDDSKLTNEVIQQATQGFNDGIYKNEFRITNSVNEMQWLKASGRVYFDEAGAPRRFAGTIRNITEQKLNEQLLKESEERFRIAADAATVLIWLSAADNTFRNYFNKSWLSFTGRSAAHQNGYGWIEHIHPDDAKKVVELYESRFKETKKYKVEYRLRRNDGEYRWLAEAGAPRFSPSGIFEGYVGTCVDIHDQKRTQEELERMIQERTNLLKNAIYNLESSNQNLEEFAYVASHDLQEPLRKIQTFSHRLQSRHNEHLSAETKLYLSKITNASERMSRLIGDLLNYSRLKNTDDLLEETDLNEVINNVLADFDLTIQQKKAEINISKLPVINAIPMRMNQLFHNLISNALKFIASGTNPVIKITSQNLSESEKEKYPTLNKQTSYTMITMQDNGIGFNEEFADKVFNIFQRLNGRSDFEGTGIGLAICKKIVINHHGIIFASAKENEGSTFNIILPYQLNPSPFNWKG